MNKLTQAISKANTLEELIPILESLLVEVNRLAASKGISAAEMQMIAVSLTRIRLQLHHLNGPAERMLAEQYLELEGKVKEIRNDLDHTKRRVSF